MNHQPSTTDKKLRLLLLEDCATDAELILHEVRRAGYAPEWQRVETEADFVAQLDAGWEIILADYALPQFTGRRALELLQARGLDVPFILVSGTIGEEVAVAAMKSGANDYLMKDQLARLGAAIERELREAAGRRQRRQAEAALRESEARLALALDQARIAYWEMDAATRTFTFNDRFYALYATTAEREGGYQMPEEVYTREFLPPEEQHLVPDDVAQLLSGELEELKQEHRIRRRDGELRHIVVRVTVIRDAAGRVVGTHGSNQDITERKLAESELRQSLTTAEHARRALLSALEDRHQAEAARQESEARFRTIIEFSPVAMAINDEHGNITDLNRQFLATIGYTLEEIPTVEAWWLRGYPDPAYRQRVAQEWQAATEKAHREGTPLDLVDLEVTCKDGSVRNIHFSVAPIGTSHVVVLHDITARKRAETDLANARAHYQSLLQTASDGLHVLNLEGELTEASDSFYRMLGYAPENPPPLNVADWDAQWTPEELKGLVASLIEHPQVFETRHRRKDGTLIEVEVNTQGIESGGQRFLYASSRDITERKRVEEALRAALAEKIVLLQEVHHRVKNNLQVIRSLLSLQANQIHEPVVLELLEVTRNRVGAMALLHENLYHSENLAQLDLGEYVESLCAQLFRASGPVHGRVRLERHVESEKISLGLDQAVPFGLLLNELVTNALKHAFPGERSGCIRLTVARATAETVRLTVTDDGVGLPAALAPSQTKSLGLQLVYMLSQQLHGTVTFERGLGTTVQILFPNAATTGTSHE